MTRTSKKNYLYSFRILIEFSTNEQRDILIVYFLQILKQILGYKKSKKSSKSDKTYIDLNISPAKTHSVNNIKIESLSN